MTEAEKQVFWTLGRQAVERLIKETQRLGIVMSDDDQDALPAVFSWWAGLMSVFPGTFQMTEAEFARAVSVQIQFSKPKTSVSS